MVLQMAALAKAQLVARVEAELQEEEEDSQPQLTLERRPLAARVGDHRLAPPHRQRKMQYLVSTVGCRCSVLLAWQPLPHVGVDPAKLLMPGM